MIRPAYNDRLFAAGPFALFLLFLLFFWFIGVFTTADTFALRDFPSFGLPLADYLGWSLSHGELPLWNPFNGCGTPYAAQWNTMVFYPPSWLFALFSPKNWLSLFCLLHLFAAGVGMHRLVWRWTDSHLAAAAAGLSYALHGLLVNALMWPNNIAALACFPWLLLAVRHAIHAGGIAIVVAAWVATAQMLTGAPEMTIFSWFLTIILIFLSKEPSTSHTQTVRRLLAVTGLTTALAAIQLLPFYELLSHSERWGAGALNQWAADPAAWLRWVAPLFDTYATPAGPRFQAGQSWTHSTYGGILPLLLGGAALSGRRQRSAAVLVAIVVVSGFCAQNTQAGFPGILTGWLPMRFPVKFLVFQALAFPLLAGLGMSALAGPDRPGPRHRSVAVGVGFTALLFLIAAWCIDGLPVERVKPAWVSLASRLTIAMIFVALGFAFTRKSATSPMRTALGIALLATLAIDLGTHQQHLAPTVSRASVQTPNESPLSTDSPDSIPPTRTTMTARAVYQSLYAVAPSLEERWQLNTAGLAANFNLFTRTPKTGGFFSLNPGAVSLLEDMMYAGPNGLHRGLLELLAASHIMTYTNQFAWATNPTPVSLVHIGAAPVFLDPDATLEFLRRPDYSPRGAVVLPESARSAITAAAAPDARAVISRFTPHEIALETESASPAIASISVTWYPCWKATIDGEETTLWPANHAFMALELPAGRHRVKLTYEDTHFEIGRAISCTSLLASVFFVLRARSRGRKDQAITDEPASGNQLERISNARET